MRIAVRPTVERPPLRLRPAVDCRFSDPALPCGRVLNLAAETQAYQALLEGHRMDPDNEDLYVDLLKARAAMEVAWLQFAVAVGE